MAFLSEAEVEEILLTQLQTLGYQRASDADIGPDGHAPERENYGDVLAHAQPPGCRGQVERPFARGGHGRGNRFPHPFRARNL